MSRLTISRAALDLIESFEGFRARAAQLKNGTYTIGFGHSATARAGMQITREQAEELLRWDLRPIEDMVRQSCHAPITQNQFDALVSFAFNIGAENFANSDVLRHINQGEPVAAAIAMSAWRRAYVNGKLIIVDALVRRRYAEVNLYFETNGARAAAPTNVIVPKIDYSAALLAPNADNIKEIAPNKNDGEFDIKPNADNQEVLVAQKQEILSEEAVQNDAMDTPAQTEAPETSVSENEIAPSPKSVQNANNSIPKAHVEAILDAKLGGGLMPFPEATIEDIQRTNGAAANESDDTAVRAANDQQTTKPNIEAPKIEKPRAMPHDTFRGQGIELKEIARPPINWAGLLPWAIAALGALAMIYGLNQMGKLDVFSAFGFGKATELPKSIDQFGFRAILIAICGFAATLLSVLSIIDRNAQNSES